MNSEHCSKSYFNIYVMFGVLAILLPAHPSIQSLLIGISLPSSLLCILLSLPVFYSLMFTRSISVDDLVFFSLATLFCAWIAFRSLGSEVFGAPGNLSSLISVLVLTPLSIFSSFVAANNKGFAINVISGLSLVVFIHVLILIFNDAGADFISLSTHEGGSNYQSTAFYVGFLGIFCCVRIAADVSSAEKVIFLLLFILIAIVISRIGARSSVVAMALTGAVLMRRALNAYMLVFILLAMTVTTLLLVLDIGVFDDFSLDLLAVKRMLALLEDGDSSSRLFLFGSAFSLWFDSAHNFFIGSGVGYFPYYIEMPDEGWYPHNFILESLAEGGAIAGLILLALGLFFVRIWLLTSDKRIFSAQMYSNAFFLYVFLAYQFMGGIQSIWILMFFFGLSAFKRC